MIDSANLIELIIATLSGGGLSYLFTLKFTRKEAEAKAMKEVQNVYQETVKDLRGDKDLLKKEIGDLRIIVIQNTNDIEELKGYECVIMDCALRKKRPRKLKGDIK